MQLIGLRKNGILEQFLLSQKVSLKIMLASGVLCETEECKTFK